MNSKEAFENIRDLIKANYPLIYCYHNGVQSYYAVHTQHII